MRFTLTYDGPLPPKGSPQDQMDIRRQVHPQLAELWAHEPLNYIGEEAKPGGGHHEEVVGRGFTSVVHDTSKLRAELDILLLREAAPGSVLSKADIDNQLKTLFDALTIPQQKQQIPEGWQPDTDQEPLHCLLQDDRHITRLNLEAERWLAAPGPQHVRLFIRVTVTKAAPTWRSVHLGI